MLASNLLSRLSPHLSERVRVVRDTTIPPGGRWVLYWLHHAMRGHENPALDVAVAISQQLDLTLLVYQGLSETYPYASDRHHTFILQGMRDLQREMADRGITYIGHVERPGHRGPHLKSLAGQAAMLITEDMPVDPTRRWLSRLLETTFCPTWCVDTACVVPMRLVEELHDRAFRFREATRTLYRERLARPWDDYPDDSPGDGGHAVATTPALPFQPIDLDRADLATLVGQCEIDHTVAPVPHTVGGSVAGYHRWRTFRETGLAGYARRRNDPLFPGVSRLSAYLHYGMVSPLRIAREAAEDHAEKFLDELLIWRELAYHFCFHHADHESLAALPSWARDTLDAHRADQRPALLSWERLARGETGDPLWDAAQQSLLIHGELHNNVRMTWAKELLRWTADPETALAMMVDLNHRYALDGRDPCSYGGLLWCLGLFDRPFPPARPIYGTIRERSSREHARRLDPVAYRRLTTQPLCEPLPQVSIIGAGISGLTCARTLSDHGVPVIVFEKSRGVGGRMATRRTEQGVVFDHGAQYFTVRDERFRRYVNSWMHDGLVRPWRGRVVALCAGSVERESSSTDRFVACPGMTAIGKHLARGLTIHTSTRIAPPTRCGDQWLLCDDSGREWGRYDVVIVAAPPPPAAELLQGVPDLAARAASAHIAPCWAVLVQFPTRLELDYDGAFVRDSPLAWIARNASKPDRDPHAETWILHAHADWTTTHLEESAESVQAQLLHAFWNVTGVPAVTPTFLAAHRWRYALPVEPLPDRALFDADLGIGACGDWCSGPRVEGAYLSGAALAGRVLGRLIPSSS